jgi:hypothetical protein
MQAGDLWKKKRLLRGLIGKVPDWHGKAKALMSPSLRKEFSGVAPRFGRKIVFYPFRPEN